VLDRYPGGGLGDFFAVVLAGALAGCFEPFGLPVALDLAGAFAGAGGF